MPACQLIAYFRVSTDQQGHSGLGLEAQRAAVAKYQEQSGGALIAAYVEIESGKRSGRPELAKALDLLQSFRQPQQVVCAQAAISTSSCGQLKLCNRSDWDAYPPGPIMRRPKRRPRRETSDPQARQERGAA
jgi:hypothetical protein